jgi:hypothetical protein
MSIPRLLKRVNSLERRVPKPPGGRLSAVVARAEHIAGREKLPIHAVMTQAIDECGRPLSLADVDLLLERYASGRMHM